MNDSRLQHFMHHPYSSGSWSTQSLLNRSKPGTGALPTSLSATSSADWTAYAVDRPMGLRPYASVRDISSVIAG